jgi:hypothetical protein
LKLPAWLNEGLAAMTVDRFWGKWKIRKDTLGLARNFRPKERPPTYRRHSRQGEKAIAYHPVRGYGPVQFLEEKCPGLLKRLFSSSQMPADIEREIAKILGVERRGFWSKINDMIVKHFS